MIVDDAIVVSSFKDILCIIMYKPIFSAERKTPNIIDLLNNIYIYSL